MREYTQYAATTRDAKIAACKVGHVAFDDADDPDAWAQVLPALDIKTDANGVRYAERAVVEAAVVLAWGAFEESALDLSYGLMEPGDPVLSRMSGVAHGGGADFFG